MNMRLHRQKGAALVEMAIVLLLFLMIVFAVFEFSIAIVLSAQLAEATRGGLRYAIVNDPVKGITLPTCIDPDLSKGETCDSGSCPDLIGGMAFAPMINLQEDINVTVEYACPDSTYLDRDGLYLVTVAVSGAKYDLIVPGVLGWDVTIELQTFKSTRLSEDLHTGG